MSFKKNEIFCSYSWVWQISEETFRLYFAYLCFADFGGKQETVVWFALKKFLKMNTNMSGILKK